jgi:ABC-type multidrug transport system fused ATPase/permease subunit
MARVDVFLSTSIDNGTQLVVQLLATIITVCIIVSYWLLLVAFAALIATLFLLIAVGRTLTETKRLSNAALSPVLSNVAEASAGLKETARAFGKREHDEYFLLFFQQRHLYAADEYGRCLEFFSLGYDRFVCCFLRNGILLL